MVFERDLTAWEARAVRNLSRAYLAEYDRALDGEGPPRLDDEHEDERRQDVTVGLKRLFEHHAKRNRRKAAR